MLRNIAILIVGAASIANLNAGSIQIPINGTNGLTSTAVSASTTATQSSGGKFGEQTYSNGGILQTTTTTTPPPTGGSTLTAFGGVTFYMVNDGGPNMWSGTNDVPGASGNPATITTTFTIPMGIFDVTNVATVLNDEYGSTTANVGNGVGVTTQVTFNFGSALTGPGFLGSETFNLVNGVDIFDSFDCTGGTLTACNAASLAMGLPGSGTYGTNGASVTPSKSVASVTSANVFSGTYTANTNGPYAGTTGNIYLDAENFYVGAFAGDELYNMVITDTATAQYQSRDELVAATVITGSPEPSTVVLFLTGIGVVGFIYRRKRAASVQA
jgi:hypothetical protein